MVLSEQLGGAFVQLKVQEKKDLEARATEKREARARQALYEQAWSQLGVDAVVEEVRRILFPDCPIENSGHEGVERVQEIVEYEEFETSSLSGAATRKVRDIHFLIAISHHPQFQDQLQVTVGIDKPGFSRFSLPLASLSNQDSLMESVAQYLVDQTKECYWLRDRVEQAIAEGRI